MEDDLIELASLVGWFELRPHFSGTGTKDAWAVVVRDLNDLFTPQDFVIEPTPSQAVAEALRIAQERRKDVAPVIAPKKLLKRPATK